MLEIEFIFIFFKVIIFIFKVDYVRIFVDNLVFLLLDFFVIIISKIGYLNVLKWNIIVFYIKY